MITAETKRNKKIAHIFAHYSDSRFDKDRTVFGEEKPGLRYDYSDRLQEWDYEKSKLAYIKAKESGKVIESAAYYDIYLSEYFGKKIRVEHIITGVNKSNGYHYNIFGYRIIN